MCRHFVVLHSKNRCVRFLVLWTSESYSPYMKISQNEWFCVYKAHLLIYIYKIWTTVIPLSCDRVEFLSIIIQHPVDRGSNSNKILMNYNRNSDFCLALVWTLVWCCTVTHRCRGGSVLMLGHADPLLSSLQDSSEETSEPGWAETYNMNSFFIYTFQTFPSHSKLYK